MIYYMISVFISLILSVFYFVVHLVSGNRGWKKKITKVAPTRYCESLYRRRCWNRPSRSYILLGSDNDGKQVHEFEFNVEGSIHDSSRGRRSTHELHNGAWQSRWHEWWDDRYQMPQNLCSHHHNNHHYRRWHGNNDVFKAYPANQICWSISWTVIFQSETCSSSINERFFRRRRSAFSKQSCPGGWSWWRQTTASSRRHDSVGRRLWKRHRTTYGRSTETRNHVTKWRPGSGNKTWRHRMARDQQKVTWLERATQETGVCACHCDGDPNSGSAHRTPNSNRISDPNRRPKTQNCPNAGIVRPSCTTDSDSSA